MITVIESQLLPTRLQEERLDVLMVSAATLTDNYIQQLVDKSRQPHIAVFEGHEDVGTSLAPGRFRSIKDYRRWAENKERVIFMLIDTANQLDSNETPDIGSIAWFGKRQHELAPGRSVTFAMRNYAADKQRQWAQYTGRGLAVPFMDTTHKLARDIYPNEKLWLDIVDGNDASRAMCVRNGYQEIVRHNDPHHDGQSRVVMVNDDAFASLMDIPLDHTA